ncbi:MAG: 30S ribosomal protein S16 [Actinobacteria bacterium]|nr:30S ribosomal protein S16 [Actinomycetota bacterium]
MAVKIRLLRVGKKKQPYYRVVVADARSPRDGRVIERIGRYSPLDDPSTVEIDTERAVDWLGKGAQPTEAVQKLLEVSGIWEQFRAGRPTADTSARKAVEHHKLALANRPPEPEPEPEPEPAPAEATEEPAAQAEEATEEPAAQAEEATEEPAAQAEEATEEPAAEGEEQRDE